MRYLNPADIPGPGDFDPPDEPEVEYYCRCFHREIAHDEEGCSDCGPGECNAFRENRKNPVEPDEADPDRDQD